MTQLLAAAGPYTLTKTWYVDGTPTDVGAVTIGIVDGSGTEVVAAATSTTNNEDGTYTYSLADQATPQELKVTWTRSSSGADLVDRMELVGNWLFTEAQARTFQAKADATSALIPLGSATEYPDATISGERSRLTEDLEFWTARGWIPRYARLELTGSGGTWLDLSRGVCRTSDGYQLHRPGRLNDIGQILTATINGETVDVSTIEIDNLHRTVGLTSGVWSIPSSTPFNVVIEYVYGLPYLVDGVDRIALKELVNRLVPSAWPDRVISADTEYGTTRFVQPGGPMGNVSQLPEVNSWVKMHDHRVWI